MKNKSTKLINIFRNYNIINPNSIILVFIRTTQENSEIFSFRDELHRIKNGINLLYNILEGCFYAFFVT